MESINMKLLQGCFRAAQNDVVVVVVVVASGATAVRRSLRGRLHRGRPTRSKQVCLMIEMSSSFLLRSIMDEVHEGSDAVQGSGE